MPARNELISTARTEDLPGAGCRSRSPGPDGCAAGADRRTTLLRRPIGGRDSGEPAEFTADRVAVLIQQHAHHHLLELGTVVFGVAPLPARLAPLSVEVDRRSVEEYQIQLGEQVAALGEQSLFDEVLVGAGRKRCGTALLILRQTFEELLSVLVQKACRLEDLV